MAYELFQRPHAKKTRERELGLFTDFTEKKLCHPEEDLFYYEKGPENGYPVILVHGWESGPGSMYGIADNLVKNGFLVMVLGVPAHGKSQLKKTNMVHTSGFIRFFLDKLGYENNFSMVTHSFGSGASTIALMNTTIKADQLIFLTTPDKIMDIFTNFRDMIQLGDKAFNHLVKLVEHLVPYRLEEFNISAFLKKVQYNKLIILHDESDKILPYKNSTSVKEMNPQAELIPFTGKGHYRLLWDEEVKQIILNRLQSR